MEYTVDRIEGGIAVCIGEDNSVRNIPTASVPFDIHESDILVFGEDENVSKNSSKAEALKKSTSKRVNNLFGRNGK